MVMEGQRSGLDRRRMNEDVGADVRTGEDRREAVRDQKNIIGMMRKIPIFKGFSDDQYRRIIAICSKRVVPEGYYLCQKGDESNELYVLLKGTMNILFDGDTALTHIDAIGLIGEIGVFTGTRRTASVRAAADCIVIQMNKTELFEMLSRDNVLSTRLLMNVIKDLAKKLQEDNTLIEELRTRKNTRIL